MVEDEDGVRELVRQILTEHGHIGADGAAWPRRADASPSATSAPIDLLVTDVVMPEMGGGELVQRLIGQRPELKVLYISGYTDDEVVRAGCRRMPGRFPAQAVHGDGLIRRVREALSGQEPGDYLTRARRFAEHVGTHLATQMQRDLTGDPVRLAPGALVACPGRSRCWSSRISRPCES